MTQISTRDYIDPIIPELRNKVNFLLKKIKEYPCICEDNLSLCFKCSVLDEYNKTDFTVREV